MKDTHIDTTVVKSRQVMEMITVANEFCLCIEDIERFDREYVLDYLQRVLPLLYLKGTLLPSVEPNDETDNERYVIEETWEYIFNLTKNLFGDDNSYYFWNPELLEATESMVSENLADMYQDLKDFVFLFSKPSYYAKVNSVHMCREMFILRWGKSLPLLIHHLHGIIFERPEGSELEDYEL
jgi:hypothetical protein